MDVHSLRRRIPPETEHPGKPGGSPDREWVSFRIVVDAVQMNDELGPGFLSHVGVDASRGLDAHRPPASRDLRCGPREGDLSCDQPEHALLCCRAALRAQAGIEAIHDDGPTIRFGFGVNTGPALAGNVGAVGRLEYTVMGETVNTASRLCGVAEGGQTWIGERTRQLVQEHMETESLPPQNLKNISAPVAAYRLLREVGANAAPATMNMVARL